VIAHAAAALAALLLAGSLSGPVASAQEAADWGPLEVAGRTVAPGETLRTFVDVAGAFGGRNRTLDTFLVVTRGARPGPTLCIVGGIHGDELNGVEIAHRVYAGTPGGELAGTLMALPAVNLQGIRSGQRYLPDGRDLNRAFPGSANGSLASRIAHSLHQGVIRHCEVLIDLHPGSGGRTNLPQIRTDLESPRALKLARSFGVGVILAGEGPTGSLRRTVLDTGVPAVIYEVGQPHRFEETEIAQGVTGVRNVMIDLGMLAGQPSRQVPEVYRRTTWVRSGDATGVFLVARQLGDSVRKGDVLGTVTDPITEASSDILAPRDGRIIGMTLPQMVLPGYALFHLGYDPE
jgi:predicted deacylase